MQDFTDFGPMNIKTRLSQHSSKMMIMCGNEKMKNEKKSMPVSDPYLLHNSHIPCIYICHTGKLYSCTTNVNLTCLHFLSDPRFRVSILSPRIFWTA